MREKTYPRQFRDDHRHQRQKVDEEIRQIVMRIMCAEKKEDDRNAEQELLCRCVLIPVIDLLPHVEIIVSSCIEFKRYASDIVKHQI